MKRPKTGVNEGKRPIKFQGIERKLMGRKQSASSAARRAWLQ